MPDKLEIKAIRKVLDAPSSKEVAELVATLIATVKKAQEAMQERVNSQITERQEALMSALLQKAQELEQAITSTKGELSTGVSTLEGFVKTSIEELRSEIPELPPEVDLSDIYNSLKEIETKIPKIPDEMKAEMIRDKLESLEGDERVDKSAIKGLEEKLNDIVRTIPAPRSGWGAHPLTIQDDGVTVEKVARFLNFTGGTLTVSNGVVSIPLGAAGTSVFSEVVAGSGTTFTLAATPTSGTERIYGMGQRLKPGVGNDYTISANILTMTNTWSAGDILADYQTP